MARTENSIKPTSKELAEMVVLKNFGYTDYYIGKIMNKSNHTITKYLNSDVFANPQVQILVEKITEREISDLKLIGLKSRSCLHKYLNAVLEGEKEPNPIAVVAIGDRSFQQRRLLEDRSTQNIGIEADMVAHSDTAELIKALKAEMARRGLLKDSKNNKEEKQKESE